MSSKTKYVNSQILKPLNKLSLMLIYLHAFAPITSSYWQSLTVFYSKVIVSSLTYTYYSVPKLRLQFSASSLLRCSNFTITLAFLIST